MDSAKMLSYSDAVITTIEKNLNNTNEIEKVQIPNENITKNSLCYNKKKNKYFTYFEDFIRRIVDLLAGIIGLILIIPLTIIVYISNKINHDDGPIFYVQERIGKNGKQFKMIKYRSMVVGAEEKLKEYLENNKEAEKEYNIYKKLKNDPRITKIGGILRKTSLDEIPQSLNLLNGSMSLVGPRPYLPSEIEDMGEYYHIIIQNKPGIGRIMAMQRKVECHF